MIDNETPFRDRRFELLWRILRRHIEQRSFVQSPAGKKGDGSKTPEQHSRAEDAGYEGMK